MNTSDPGRYDVLIGAVALGAVVVALVAGGGGAADTSPPVSDFEATEATDGGCRISGSFDPGAISWADRIVVEAGGDAEAFDRATRWGYSGIPEGSNVTVFAVDLGGDHATDVLVDGQLGPDCRLVGGEAS